MEATIEPGPDGEIGTDDDIVKIAPVRKRGRPKSTHPKKAKK
jgi:hypothetical protein